MKFDSYTRFLKSPVYQECILAEVEGRPISDPQNVSNSPTSKHSLGSEWSNVSTPKKVIFFLYDHLLFKYLSELQNFDFLDHFN